jgi:hypothetical protein
VLAQTFSNEFFIAAVVGDSAHLTTALSRHNHTLHMVIPDIQIGWKLKDQDLIVASGGGATEQVAFVSSLEQHHDCCWVTLVRGCRVLRVNE